MISGSMQPAKAKTQFWYLFRLLLGLVLFYFLITSHERSTILLCSAGVNRAARNCELFAPALMAPRGDALYRSLVYLSFMAGDGLDCLCKGENHSELTSDALGARLVHAFHQS
jgi:hypothetical protein